MSTLNISVLFTPRGCSGRPVKWTDERSESFLSDRHGRDHEMTGEVALDAQGNILAVALTGCGNAGAYLDRAAALHGQRGEERGRRLRDAACVEVDTKGIFTNTTPVGAYRGAGRPEGNYYMERLLEHGGRARWASTRLELRRRNHIRAERCPTRRRRHGL